MPQFVYTYAGIPLTTTTSSGVQTALVQQILTAAQAAPSTAQVLYAPGSEFSPDRPIGTVAVTSPIFLEFQYQFEIDMVAGAASVPAVQVLMDAGSGQTYTTNGTALSTVVAGDNTQPVIINNSPSSALLAVTGAVLPSANGTFFANTLEGLAGANQFVTGANGRDAVVLNGAANSLTSNGFDVVLVGGPSTISAAAGSTDMVTVTAATSLAFVNAPNGSTVDSITGAANSIILLAGGGNTAITSGAGVEYDFVDTSAGSVTLTANSAGSDLFTFIKDQNSATANVQVNAFTASDVVAVHGYASFSVAPAAGAAGNAVLSLSDGSQVTFNGVAAATLQAAVKIV